MSIRLSPAGSGSLTRAGAIITYSEHTFFLRFTVQALPGAGELGMIATLQENSDFTGWLIGVLDDGRLRLRSWNSEDNYDGTTVLALNTTYTLWLRVQTEDGGGRGTGSLYLDGGTTAEIVSTVTQFWGSNNMTFALGADPLTGTGSNLAVTVQDARLWTVDRPASAAAAEIASCGAPASTTNLRAAWALPDTSTLTDSSGNGLTLTLNGTGATTQATLCSGGTPTGQPTHAMYYARLRSAL